MPRVERVFQELMRFAGVRMLTTVDFAGTPPDDIIIGRGLKKVEQVGSLVKIPDNVNAGVRVRGGSWINLDDKSLHLKLFVQDVNRAYLTPRPMHPGEQLTLSELNGATITFHGAGNRIRYRTRGK